jgi:hypothetical protein
MAKPQNDGVVKFTGNTQVLLLLSASTMVTRFTIGILGEKKLKNSAFGSLSRLDCMKRINILLLFK